MNQKRWISRRAGWCWGAGLLLSGCTAPVESGRAEEAPLPRAVAQRVTATVQRQAVRLVRLETERESLLTTPEHPFATPGSGWIRAERLLPGDEVLSERFGAVRLLAVRGEVAARPVPVFNLSVASSHAYFVGADRVLVHNTKCKPGVSEARDEKLERLLREREQINGEIKALTKTTPESPRLAALKLQRDALTRKIKKLSWKQRRAQGMLARSRDERALLRYGADHESARNALEAVQRELAELESRAPTSEAEKARKKKLERQILALQLSYERTGQIVAWLGELAALEQDTPATDADRRALEERKKALRADLKLERRRQVDWDRKRRAAPESRKEKAAYGRSRDGRRYRTAAYVADTERPRDALELLEAELSRRLEEAPSERREARVHQVTEQLETMKRLVELRRERKRVFQRRIRARDSRERRIAGGKDPSEFDRKLERTELRLRALRIEIAQLRVRERLLVRLGATRWADAPGSADEARLRVFDRQLAEGVADEQALAGIERALDAMDPPHADWEAVRDEADAVLSEREELMEPRRSPARAAELASSFARLERELREERAAVEVAASALANEQARIQATQAGSSRGPSWQERLRGVQEEQVQLRAQWRAGLEERLDSARQRLRVRRSVFALRDAALEAELVREIALLEREVQRAGG